MSAVFVGHVENTYLFFQSGTENWNWHFEKAGILRKGTCLRWKGNSSVGVLEVAGWVRKGIVVGAKILSSITCSGVRFAQTVVTCLGSFVYPEIFFLPSVSNSLFFVFNRMCIML